MNKFLKTFCIATIIVFLLSFIVGNEIDFFSRILYSAIIGAICVFLVFTKHKQPGTNIQQKIEVIYVYETNKRQFKYRIENGYIYEGMSRQFAYQIKNNKIYKGMSATPILSIEGNKVYEFMGNKTALYTLKDNKIYKGELGSIPVYELKNTPY